MNSSDFVLVIYGKAAEEDYQLPEVVKGLGYKDAIRMEFRLQKTEYIAKRYKISKLKDCFDQRLYEEILKEGNYKLHSVHYQPTYYPLWKANAHSTDFAPTLHAHLEYRLISECGGLEAAIEHLRQNKLAMNNDSVKYYRKNFRTVFKKYAAVDNFNIDRQSKFMNRLSFV